MLKMHVHVLVAEQSYFSWLKSTQLPREVAAVLDSENLDAP